MAACWTGAAFLLGPVAQDVAADPGNSRAEFARAAISATPLVFVPVDAESGFDFACQGLDYGVFLDGADATLLLRKASGEAIETAAVRFVLRGARAGVVPVAEEMLPGVSNRYSGPDPAGWRVGVPQFGRVRCSAVHPGIDLVYYGSQEQLEYDFEIAPGADPRSIAFDVVGATSMRIDEQGDLVVSTSAGDLVQRAPVAYQWVASERVAVTAEYELCDGALGIRVGAYDASLALVIDPVVQFSTFLGGTGADQAWDFDVDSFGDICVAGYTASVNFPHTSPGGLTGYWDMFVAKFDATGSTLVYSTFLSAGTSSASITEFATGVACGALGNAYVTGRTNATNFPTLNARQPQNAGNTDAVVFELDAAGQIVFSTYHGGSGNENGRYDSTSRCGRIAVDPDGFVYVAGSSNSPNFPLANALDSVVSGSSCAGGCADMFLSKFAPDGQTLVFSTFLGDALPEEPVGIHVDAQRDVFLAGNNGTILLYKIAADGQSLRWSRSIDNGPGGGYSTLIAFDVDAAGRVAITGKTSSGAFPTTPGTWQPSYTGCFSGTCEEAFVTVLAPNNGPILASTYVGEPTYNDSGTAIRFDRSGDVVFALRSQRNSGPWFGELWKFDPTLSQRLAQVPICGHGEATDLFVDAQNDVRVIGWVWAGSDPAGTPGAFQPTHGGNIDVFLSGYAMQSPPPTSTLVPYCLGDGSGTACPCGNDSAPGSVSGCLSSLGIGGRLTSTGLASLGNDTLVLHGAQMPNSSALYFQGTALAGSGAGLAFGDGLRCAAGSLVRLGTKVNVLGGSAYPEAADSRISVRGGVASPGPRVYQVWYRNAAAFCTSSTFNLTNGGELLWQL